MKPLHLNLAARPFRDYRPVYAVVVLASLLIAFLMLNNIETWYRYISETRQTRDTIAKLERDTATERSRAAAADAQLRNVNLAMLREETRFINSRLAERAFSWSELLERLEGVLPADVRLRTISPSFDKTGLVHLELSCEAKTADGMLQTLGAFQKDPRFANAFPHSESTATTGLQMFNIGVDYRPAITRVVK